MKSCYRLRSVWFLVSHHPAVCEDVRERDPLLLLHPQAGRDEVPAGRAHVLTELHTPGADLLVPLEGNVTAHHVVQQHSQGPDSRAVTLVLIQFDPLRGCVDSGPWDRAYNT